MDKKYVKLILFVVIILLLIIMLLLITASDIKKMSQPTEDNINSTNKQELISDDVIIPNYSSLFFGKYVNGVVKSKELYETIYEFTGSVLPKYFDDLKNSTEEETYIYYEKNSSDITKYMKMSNKKQFSDFMDSIKSIKADKLELVALEFVEDSITYTDISTTAKLSVKYKGIDPITINIKVFKRAQESSPNIVFY